MTNDQLKQYVSTERARGVTDQALREELARTGWSVKDIEEVMMLNGGDLQNQTEIPNELGIFRRLAWGRIGRLRYFLGGLFGFVISILPVVVLIALWGVLGYLQASAVSTANNPFFVMVSILIPILLALSLIMPFLFLNIMLTIRRLHDLNMSGWFILIGYLPYVGVFFSLYILFAPGTSGKNNFGLPSDPKKEFIADIFNRSQS